MNKPKRPQSIEEIAIYSALAKWANKIIAKRLLSVEEAAYYIGVSPRTIYNAVAPKSKVPFPVKPKRIGKLVRFDIRDLDQYVDSLSGEVKGGL